MAYIPEILTAEEAADRLGVDLPTLAQLQDDGYLRCEQHGEVRRVRAEDVLAYEDLRRARNSAILDELTALSEELGLYDHDYPENGPA